MAPPAPSVRVRIIDVKGLYWPGHPDSSPRPPGPARAAGYQPGYKSLDNRGRIYLDHDLQGRWTPDTQLIEVTAEITSDGELPGDARIHWSVRDPDDPFNQRSEVHPSSGLYIDGNDYDAAGNYVAPAPDDNEGTHDGTVMWEPGGGIALFDETATSATTAIVNGRSTVRYHTSNVAGDNLILRADLAEAGSAAGDETGIMTLWRRLDVEYVRMESALPLPVDEVPAHFEPAFVQLDFAAERVVPDLPYMAPDEGTLGESSSRYVDEAFSHELDPGWFCLISALEPHPLPEARGEVLFSGTVKIEQSGEGESRVEYIEIPGSHPDADLVRFTWEGGTVSFGVSATRVLEGPPTRTHLRLEPHDVQPWFTAGDGSVAHAYAKRVFFFPTARRWGAAWDPPGYGIPEVAQAEVRSPGAFYTIGISPTIDVGERRYFAGRTIVFSHHGALWNAASGAARPGYGQRVLRTIVHELVHGLGMPHKCGYFDYRTPRRATCCMNYGPNWMLDEHAQLIPQTSGLVGNEMCGRHLKEVRRVHLSENKGLRWR